ncbi:hypothetical protein R75461_07279 [Paraburkholderia nemoris]|nr:hypothetical protein R75461_07279 [Paraburkholderia nemoris]
MDCGITMGQPELCCDREIGQEFILTGQPSLNPPGAAQQIWYRSLKQIQQFAVLVDALMDPALAECDHIHDRGQLTPCLDSKDVNHAAPAFLKPNPLPFAFGFA